jgi:regulator of nonsense transcripts 1
LLGLAASLLTDTQEKRPLVWVSVRGTEAVPPKTKSYVNYEEIDAVQRVATFLREKHATATIAVLTFYKGQLQELMRATPAALGVEVLTVDSCQGSEFDYVILSTVRANLQGTIGFVKGMIGNPSCSPSRLVGFCVSVSLVEAQLSNACTQDTHARNECLIDVLGIRQATNQRRHLALPLRSRCRR